MKQQKTKERFKQFCLSQKLKRLSIMLACKQLPRPDCQNNCLSWECMQNVDTKRPLFCARLSVPLHDSFYHVCYKPLYLATAQGSYHARLSAFLYRETFALIAQSLWRKYYPKFGNQSLMLLPGFVLARIITW